MAAMNETSDDAAAHQLVGIGPREIIHINPMADEKARLIRLVAAAIERCPDYMDPASTKYATIRDMFGHHLPTSDLKSICDALYVTGERSIRCLDSTGNWALFRQSDNSLRGEKGSQIKRKASVEHNGIRLDVREPPWVIAAADGNPEHFDLIHWATLLADGARLAWMADTKKLNKMLQRDLVKPIPGCKELNRRSPPPVIRFYIDYANELNQEATATTPLEIWRSTKIVKQGFKAQRKINALDWASLGTTALLEKEFHYADMSFAGRWAFNNHYYVCARFYASAPLVACHCKRG
jgi:hypothetical protein